MKAHDSQQLCQSTKAELPLGICRSNVAETCNNTGKDVCESGILQQIVSSTNTRQKMETSNQFKYDKQASIGPNIQNGDGRSDKKLHLQRGMGSLCRSDRRVFSHSHS